MDGAVAGQDWMWGGKASALGVTMDLRSITFHLLDGYIVFNSTNSRLNSVFKNQQRES